MDPTSVSVLLVEDDLRLAELTKQFLERHGLRVDVVDEGRAALARVALGVDVVLLDLTLRGAMDGLSLCRAIRSSSDVPIVMISARGDEQDRIRGLEMGADDYLPKPFSSRELLARVQAQARRRLGKLVPRRTIDVGALRLDLERREAWLRDRPLALTKLELDLLVALASRPGTTLGREQLLDLVHGGGDDVFDRAIDVLVSRLRTKLGPEGHLIRTVRGVGYRLVPPEEP
jgi:two-component system OmpR family response regulator